MDQELAQHRKELLETLERDEEVWEELPEWLKLTYHYGSESDEAEDDQSELRKTA